MMSTTLLLSAILLSHTANLGNAETMDDGCVGTIGSRPTSYNFASLDTFSGISGLFLNTRNATSCNGTVIAWDFCYYISFQQSMARELLLSIQAGIWRKVAKEYHRVQSTSIVLSVQNPENGFQFVCQHQTLQDDERFAVLVGDIVGIYVEDLLGENLIPALGVAEPCGGIIKTDNVSDITSPVLESDLFSASHSLYLMAIIGNFSESSDSIDQMCSESVSSELTEREIYLFVAGALLLVLLVTCTIIAVVCCQLKRNKPSGPVLITKLKHNNRMQQTENQTTHENAETETAPSRNNVESGTDHGLPLHTYGPPLSSPPVLIIHSISGDQSEIASPNMSPKPVVCTASFDVPSYDQDQTLRKTKPQFHGIRAQKNVRFALRRSYSAAEALNLSHAGTIDTDSQFTSSARTDYPYVFHAFEVLGKDQAHVRSLPNVCQFSHYYTSLDMDDSNPSSSTDVKPLATGKDNQNGIQYVNIGTVNFSKFELSYSYPNKRRMVRIFPDSLPHNVSGIYSNNDHPSNWTPTSQLAKSNSPVHKETNDILLPPMKNIPKHKPKPQISPRKELVCRAAQRNDGANMSGQMPHKYTGLLSATRESVHKYVDLRKGAIELNELPVSDIEAERAYPNEWCN